LTALQYPDPYEGMSDEEVEEELDKPLAKHRPKTLVVFRGEPRQLLMT
jgi:hypothetical protein